MIVLSLINRYHRIITEATEVNGGICIFTHKLHYLLINKMRTRPIINLNVLKIKLIEKCDIQVVINIFAVIMITIAHTKLVNELFHAPARLVITLSVVRLEMSKYRTRSSKLSYLEENYRTRVKCSEYSFLSRCYSYL